ncbi:MAG: ferric reductase-like transmembrane domain-containing protein [Acidobacteriota bacterium]|nr:ferric reductase-like transmembrane domain-containing protein [Acidobacteriota bacterium]
MGLNYQAVGWNPQKKVYDRILVLGVLLYLIVFIVGGFIFFPTATIETLLIRAFGTAAMVLLHIILMIGPLCRLDTRFLPLLYNRRHMGVTMFLTALIHAFLVTMQYHAIGDANPIVSIFTANTAVDSLGGFPFQPLGFFALIILFLMAATSHDFWLRNLTPPVWKILHMGVYLAYLLLVGHVVLGVLQAETSPIPAVAMAVGIVLVVGLHIAAGYRDKVRVKERAHGTDYIDVCGVFEIPEKRARIVSMSGERVAIFKYDGKISAISNVCRHQNGPLGEGKIIDGCVTCPWHGFQYRPEDGRAPAPFEDKVPTFRVKLRGDRVMLHPIPNPPGTPVEPAVIGVDGGRR